MPEKRNVYFEAIDDMTDADEIDSFADARVASLQKKGFTPVDAQKEVAYSIKIALGSVDRGETTARWNPVIERLLPL